MTSRVSVGCQGRGSSALLIGHDFGKKGPHGVWACMFHGPSSNPMQEYRRGICPLLLWRPGFWHMESGQAHCVWAECRSLRSREMQNAKTPDGCCSVHVLQKARVCGVVPVLPCHWQLSHAVPCVKRCVHRRRNDEGRTNDHSPVHMSRVLVHDSACVNLSRFNSKLFLEQIHLQ